MKNLVITALCAVVVLGGISAVPVAHAYTGTPVPVGGSTSTRVKDRQLKQERMKQLATTIKQLKAEVRNQELLGSMKVAKKHLFETNLGYGSTHSDVTELQKELIRRGYMTIPAPTGYYGRITVDNMMVFQATHPEIGAVTGYFGPRTRAVLNR